MSGMVAQQPLTVEQVKAGLETAKRIDARSYALACIASKHGLRASELAHLKLEDFNFREKTLKTHPGKNSLPTVEALDDSTIEAVQAWLASPARTAYTGDGGFLFPGASGRKPITRKTVYNIFRDIAELAGLPEASRAPHAWRHSIGQALADAGMPVQNIARVLRHKSINSTMHYFKPRQAVIDKAKTELLQW